MSDQREEDLKVSSAADEAMARLVELFSDPSLPSKARLRCSVEGPDDFDVLFESIIDDHPYHVLEPIRIWRCQLLGSPTV
jgi:hypothetical protein